MAGSFDLSIPLDVAVVASNPQRFAVRGKYIQIDPGSTGQANLRINSVSDTPRLAYPGQQFSPGDFTDLYFDYIAQPGKFLHVVYGETPDILSAGSKTISDPPIVSNFFSANHNASTTNQIILAANNTKGIKILGGAITALPNGAATTNEVSAMIFYTLAGINIYVGSASLRTPAISGVRQNHLEYIDQMFIPPNSLLTADTVINGNGVATYMLNYEILR